jgi:hypothetical protein
MDQQHPLEKVNNTFDQTFNLLFDAYQHFKASSSETAQAIRTSLNVKRKHHILKKCDAEDAYARIIKSDNRKKQKISNEAQDIVSRIQKEYEKIRKEVRRQSGEIRKVVDKNVYEAEVAHNKQMSEYDSICADLKNKINVAKSKFDVLLGKEEEFQCVGDYSKEEIEALGHTINIQEKRVTSLQNRLKNFEKIYQKAILKIEKFEKQQQLEKEMGEAGGTDDSGHGSKKENDSKNCVSDSKDDDDQLKRAKLELLRWRTQANILQSVITSKEKDANQHHALRANLEEALNEIINIKNTRENELVECNKDLTRLKMSLKPLLIYSNKNH